MNGVNELDAVDRMTLAVWRAGNLVKWCIAALAVAFAVAGAFLYAWPQMSFTNSARDAVLLALFILIPSLLSAIAIGAIVGRHVHGRVELTAATLAVLHIGLTLFIAIHLNSPVQIAAPIGRYFVEGPIGSTAPEIVVILAEVYTAAMVARGSAKRRPAALRRA